VRCEAGVNQLFRAVNFPRFFLENVARRIFFLINTDECLSKENTMKFVVSFHFPFQQCTSSTTIKTVFSDDW
jgi:hypothetical protein